MPVGTVACLPVIKRVVDSRSRATEAFNGYDTLIEYSFERQESLIHADAHGVLNMKDRRAYKRKSVLLTAKLHYDGVIWDCEVLDVSDNGAGVRVAYSLLIGAAVMLKINRLGVFPGKVRWQSGDRVGIQFLEDAREVRERIQGALSRSSGLTEEEIAAIQGAGAPTLRPGVVHER